MNDNETVDKAAETEVKPVSKLAKAGALAGKGWVAAKWVWSIPFIRSMIGTRLAQAGIIGAIALAVSDKALGN